MPFWLYMRKESVGAAENLPPELEMHGGIVEIPSEDLHVVSRYIAKWAWQYDKGALLKKCMLNWQKKNEVSLPYNAFSYLSAEAQAHTKEAAKYVYLDLLNILCGKNTMNMYGYVHFGALNFKALLPKYDQSSFAGVKAKRGRGGVCGRLCSFWSKQDSLRKKEKRGFFSIPTEHLLSMTKRGMI